MVGWATGGRLRLSGAMVAVVGALVRSGGVGVASGMREDGREAMVVSRIMVSAGAVTRAGGGAACFREDLDLIAMVK